MTQANKGAVPAVKVTAEVSPGTWCNFRFDKPFKIGRLKDCDLFIDNSFVSRAHAEVVFENGHWTIRDLGSANGLFFRGQSVPSVPVSRANDRADSEWRALKSNSKWKSLYQHRRPRRPCA